MVVATQQAGESLFSTLSPVSVSRSLSTFSLFLGSEFGL